MELPGESAGRLISIQPARGPELIRRKSLLILDSVTAQDLTAPDTARKKSGFLEAVEEYSTGRDAGNGRVLNYISADGKKFGVDGLVGRVEFYVSHQKDGDGLVNRTYKLKIDDSLFQAHMASLKKQCGDPNEIIKAKSGQPFRRHWSKDALQIKMYRYGSATVE